MKKVEDKFSSNEFADDVKERELDALVGLRMTLDGSKKETDPVTGKELPGKPVREKLKRYRELSENAKAHKNEISTKEFSLNNLKSTVQEDFKDLEEAKTAGDEGLVRSLDAQARKVLGATAHERPRKSPARRRSSRKSTTT